MLIYPVPKNVYESPVQGLTGLWGGVGGALVSGASGDDFWTHIRFTATDVTSGNSQSGPTLTNIRNGLSSPAGDDMTWKTDTSDLNSNSGIILLRIPANDSYKITLRGADSGPAYTAAGPGDTQQVMGRGAEVYATVSLTKDTVLAMLLGMTPPGTDASSSGSAGGGGSFAYSSPSMTSSAGFGSNTLWVAAGGGGGWGHGTGSQGAKGGAAPHNSIQMAPGTGTGSGSGPAGQGTRNNGGGGNGGGSPNTNGNGGAGSGWQGAGGDSSQGTEGGQWSSNGQLNGGQGGNQIGGWGGGGGATGNGVPGGGGGGYSGGDGGNGWGGSVWGGGAGGGSYTNPQASATGGTTNGRFGQGTTPSHGFIQIERV